MSTRTDTGNPVRGTARRGGAAPEKPADRLRRLLGIPLVRRPLVAVAALVALYLFSSGISPYQDLQLATAGYYVCAVAGLTVLTGVNGQISLGHGALMAVGAYTTGLLVNLAEWPLLPALLGATAVTAAVGALVGAAAARLRGPYLAGATLALGVGLPALADYRHLAGVLGGQNGLLVAIQPPPASLGEDFPLERWQAWISGGAAVLTLLLLVGLTSSRLGRSWRAVRDDEDAAALAGIHVARTRVLAFVVSAACAGLGGGLLAVVTTLAAPGAFPLTLSLSLLAAAVLGGLGSLGGAVFGAAVLVLLPEWSGDLAAGLDLSREVYANLPLAVYGVVLALVMLLFPRGLRGGLQRLAAVVRTRVRAR